MSEKKVERGGGITMPDIPVEEAVKWTTHFSKIARHWNKNDTRKGHTKDDEDDDDEDDIVKNDAADGPADAGDDDANDDDATVAAIRRRQKEKQQPKKKESKTQSEFRVLQLSLQTFEGIVAVLQAGMMNGSKKMIPLFAEHKNLAVFFQALFSSPSSPGKQQKNKKGGAAAAASREATAAEAEQEDEAGEDEQTQEQQISRTVLVTQFIKTCKPHVWTLLSLLSSSPSSSPLTSPCLKFVSLCHFHGVGTEKWAATALPTAASAQHKQAGTGDSWTEPALPPAALLRALENRSWFEYLCAMVEVAERSKDVVKLSYRVTKAFEALEKRQEKEAMEAAAAAKTAAADGGAGKSKTKKKSSKNDDNNDDDDDDEDAAAAGKSPEELQHEEDGALMVAIPPSKLALLASKFASKLLRAKSRFFPSSDEEEQSNNINTIAYASDCLNALTKTMRHQTTLKKVANACIMMMELLPKTATGDADGDDCEASKYRSDLEAIAHRCNGGSSEEEVALAATRQLSCVAKFKSAKTVAEINAAVDEAVGRVAAGADEEAGESAAATAATAVAEEIRVIGDDVVSAMAVAVNTILGPVQKVVKFAEQNEQDLEDELAAEMKMKPKKKNNGKRGDAVPEPVDTKEAKLALQKRVMKLLEREVLVGRRLPRRAQAFLDRCKQELRRRERKE